MEDPLIHQTEMLCLHYSSKLQLGWTLSEFEHQAYEAACRAVTAALNIKRLAMERWLAQQEEKTSGD